MMSLAPDIPFLDRLADVADRVTLPLFRSGLPALAKSSTRGDFDPVTEADKDAETAMRALIAATFPSHGIAGEEFPDVNPEASHVWHLDPIDGTRQFITGVPLWATMAGLVIERSPTLGIVSQPFTGERFYGAPGRALYRRGQDEHPLRTRDCADASAASLFSTTPHLFFGDKADRFERLRRTVRLVRYGIDCYAFVLLAMGFVDVVVETGLDDHDIVPLVPIIEAAGGVVTDWQGRRAAGGGDVVAVGDRRLLDAVLRNLGA
jgi:myo-inositol-1(or 4)-monophosphatase